MFIEIMEYLFELYSTVTFLIYVGMLMAEKKTKFKHVLLCVFAPVVVPLMIGMYLEENSKKGL